MTAARGRRRAPAAASSCRVVLATAAATLAACASLGPGTTACVVVSPPEGGQPFGAWPLASSEPVITVSYLHSVTNTPVVERYRVYGATLVQTELRFREHGPGLPTEPDVGQAWGREGDWFVVRLGRSFDAILARVDADQAPRLDAEAASVNLAQWGRRTVRISTRAGRCPPR